MFQAQNPYHLPLLGTGISTEAAAQGGQSFPTAPEGWRCHPTAHQDPGKNHWDIRETQDLTAGDSQKCTSSFSTTISAQRLLLPSSEPMSWPPAQGSCRDITPRDAGCEEQSATGLSTTSLPSAGQHPPPRAPLGQAHSLLCLKHVSESISFHQGPKGGEAASQAGLRPVRIPPSVTPSPCPKEPPALSPSHHPWAGREGEPRFQGPLNTNGIFLAASKCDQKELCRTMGKIPPLVQEPSGPEQCRGEGHGELRHPIRAIPVSLSAKQVHHGCSLMSELCFHWHCRRQSLLQNLRAQQKHHFAIIRMAMAGFCWHSSAVLGDGRVFLFLFLCSYLAQLSGKLLPGHSRPGSKDSLQSALNPCI